LFVVDEDICLLFVTRTKVITIDTSWPDIEGSSVSETSPKINHPMSGHDMRIFFERGWIMYFSRESEEVGSDKNSDITFEIFEL
jgi:hypothetical protein